MSKITSFVSNFMMKIFSRPTKKTFRGYTVYKNLAEVGDGGKCSTEMLLAWLLSLPRTASLETNRAKSLKLRAPDNHDFCAGLLKSCLQENLSEIFRRTGEVTQSKTCLHETKRQIPCIYLKGPALDSTPVTPVLGGAGRQEDL